MIISELIKEYSGLTQRRQCENEERRVIELYKQLIVGDILNYKGILFKKTQDNPVIYDVIKKEITETKSVISKTKLYKKQLK